MNNPKYQGQLTTYATNTIIILVGTSPYDILEELAERASEAVLSKT